MIRTSSDKLTQSMIAQGAPPDIAAYKVRAWKGGNVVAIFGGIVALVSFAFPALSFIKLGTEPSVSVLIFAGLGIALGFLLVYIGGHAASGEAMDAAGKAGNRLFAGIASAARIVRGKNGV